MLARQLAQYIVRNILASVTLTAQHAVKLDLEFGNKAIK
jgi:hypothetical protein